MDPSRKPIRCVFGSIGCGLIITILTTTLAKTDGDVRVAGYDVDREAGKVRRPMAGSGAGELPVAHDRKERTPGLAPFADAGCATMRVKRSTSFCSMRRPK